VAVQLDNQNILYLGIPNPLTIVAEGYKSKNLVVTTDNGTISMDSFGRAGHYNIWPARTGTAELTICAKKLKGNIKIASGVFRVKRLSLSKPRLGGKTGGEISQLFLCSQIAPEASYDGYCGRCSIRKFSILVYRRNREIFSRTFTSSKSYYARIDSVTNDFFYKLKNNDKVIFKDMIIRDFDGTPRDLEPMVFTVTDAHKYRRMKSTDTAVIIDPTTGAEYKQFGRYKYTRVR
jgi:hypothetical protein